MDKYLISFRGMFSLRGLTDHTVTSHSTYISAYLQYLSNNGSVAPEDASYQPPFRKFDSYTRTALLV